MVIETVGRHRTDFREFNFFTYPKPRNIFINYYDGYSNAAVYMIRKKKPVLSVDGVM